MPLLPCGVGSGVVVAGGFVSCAVVLLLLKATLMLVFLKRFVIFLPCGEVCVNVAHFVSRLGVVGGRGWLRFCCMLCLSFVRR
jgi:hypothetical protein